MGRKYHLKQTRKIPLGSIAAERDPEKCLISSCTAKTRLAPGAKFAVRCFPLFVKKLSLKKITIFCC
jgi:hypothetical protein